MFFGGLKGTNNVTAQFMPQFRQNFCRTKQNCGVAVVAAGMHTTSILGAIWDVVLLKNGQRVNIRTQPDSRAGFGAMNDRNRCV